MFREFLVFGNDKYWMVVTHYLTELNSRCVHCYAHHNDLDFRSANIVAANAVMWNLENSEANTI